MIVIVNSFTATDDFFQMNICTYFISWAYNCYFIPNEHVSWSICLGNVLSVSELPFLNECQHKSHFLYFIVMVMFNEPISPAYSYHYTRPTSRRIIISVYTFPHSIFTIYLGCTHNFLVTLDRYMLQP